MIDAALVNQPDYVRVVVGLDGVEHTAGEAADECPGIFQVGIGIDAVNRVHRALRQDAAATAAREVLQLIGPEPAGIGRWSA